MSKDNTERGGSHELVVYRKWNGKRVVEKDNQYVSPT